MKVLIVGRSHVQALALALTDEERRRIRVINTWGRLFRPGLAAGKLDLNARPLPEAPVVALSMAFNLHNVMSLMEMTEPVALGHAHHGRLPAIDPQGASGEPPRFVPRDLMRQHMRTRLATMEEWLAVAHARFPQARIVHLCPPPPVRALRPPASGAPAGFKGLDFLQPPELRLELWAMEREIAREMADRFGAGFLRPPEAAVGPDGLLADDYWDDDPTHGNAAYGRLVLDQILRWAKRTRPRPDGGVARGPARAATAAAR